MFLCRMKELEGKMIYVCFVSPAGALYLFFLGLRLASMCETKLRPPLGVSGKQTDAYTQTLALLKILPLPLTQEVTIVT